MENNPEKNNKLLRNTILLAGCLGGAFSIFPVINLLNLFFLFWFIAAGFFCVNQLQKKDFILNFPEAALYAGISGLISGTIFTIYSTISFLSISAEKFQHNIQKIAQLFKASDEEIGFFSDLSNARRTIIIAILIFSLLGVFASACGGLIARLIAKKAAPSNKDTSNLDG